MYCHLDNNFLQHYMTIEQGYIFLIEVELFTKTENECKIE